MRKPNWNTECASTYLLNLTVSKAKSLLIESSYSSSYRALVRLASNIEDDPANEGFAALAHATYGWMPTILKCTYPSHFNALTPISAIKSIDTVSSARAFLRSADNKAPINGSWVGTSKFLHFLNPKVFPIWDSRVATNFHLNWSYQINTKQVYLQYFDFVHSEIAKGHKWLDETVGNAGKGREPEKIELCVSRIRCLELVLFERNIKQKPNGNCLHST